MKSFLFAAVCLVTVSAAPVAADPVSRLSADLYVATDGSAAIATEGCTQTARAMEARLVEFRGHTHVVFYDRDGEEEADCRVTLVVRRAKAREGVRREATRVARR